MDFLSVPEKEIDIDKDSLNKIDNNENKYNDILNEDGSSGQESELNDLKKNYQLFANKSFETIIKYDKGDKENIQWTFVPLREEGIEVYKGTVRDNSWNALKAKIILKSDSKKIANLINDPLKLSTYDEMVDKCKIIENLNDKISIRYVEAKPFFPTSARDFLVISSEKEIKENSDYVNGTIVISTRSIKLKNLPEQKGFVRADTIISGYIIRPIYNDDDNNNNPSIVSCEVTLICHMDLGGFIPPSVINLIGSSAPIKLLRKMKSIIEKNK